MCGSQCEEAAKCAGAAFQVIAAELAYVAGLETVSSDWVRLLAKADSTSSRRYTIHIHLLHPEKHCSLLQVGSVQPSGR